MNPQAMIDGAFRRAFSPPPALLQRAIEEAMEAARPRTAEEVLRDTPKIDARPVAEAAGEVSVPTSEEIAREFDLAPAPLSVPSNARAFEGAYRRSWLTLLVPPRLLRYCYGNPPRYGVDFEKEALKSLSHRIVLGHLISEMDAGRWPRDLREVAVKALMAEREYAETIHKVNTAMKRVKGRAQR